MFERAQLGRSEIERRVSQELRSAGIDPESVRGQFIAEQIRLNGVLTETRDISKDALKGIIADLKAGKSGAEAFANALSRVGDRLLDKGIDAALSMGLKALSGLGGGGIGVADPTFGGFSLAGSSVHAVKLHSGGRVGSDGVPMQVDARLFANAPRMHAGGIIGTDEVPVIAQRGERMLRRGETRGEGVAVNYAPVYNVSGSGPEIDRLMAQIARDRANEPNRMLRLIHEARSNRVL